MSNIIPKSWEVPETFRERVGNEYGRQRLMADSGHLLMILHQVPGPDEDDRRGALFWRTPSGEWQTNLSGSGKNNLHQHLKDYADRIDQLENALDVAHDAKSLFTIQKAVIPISRAMKNGAQVFQAAREAAKDVKELIILRDQAYVQDRAAEILHADVKAAIDFEMTEQAEKQAATGLELARSGHRLNLLAALFLPLTAITSVFGMNMASGLDNDNPIYFWIVLFVGVAIGFIMKAVLSDKRPNKD